MTTTTLEAPIALEITISETLFRRLQQVLDAYPTQSLDDLTNQALTAYLLHLSALEGNSLSSNPLTTAFSSGGVLLSLSGDKSGDKL